MTRTATCRCGQLSATCTGEPVRGSVCHCYDCQKRSGSAFAVQARFPSEAVTISGEHKLYSHVRTRQSGLQTRRSRRRRGAGGRRIGPRCDLGCIGPASVETGFAVSLGANLIFFSTNSRKFVFMPHASSQSISPFRTQKLDRPQSFRRALQQRQRLYARSGAPGSGSGHGRNREVAGTDCRRTGVGCGR